MVTMVFELLQRTIGLSRNGCGQFQHLQHFNHIGIFCFFLFMDFIRFLSIQLPSQRRNQRSYASFSTQTLFPNLIQEHSKYYFTLQKLLSFLFANFSLLLYTVRHIQDLDTILSLRFNSFHIDDFLFSLFLSLELRISLWYCRGTTLSPQYRDSDRLNARFTYSNFAISSIFGILGNLGLLNVSVPHSSLLPRGFFSVYGSGFCSWLLKLTWFWTLKFSNLFQHRFLGFLCSRFVRSRYQGSRTRSQGRFQGFFRSTFNSLLAVKVPSRLFLRLEARLRSQQPHQLS